MEELVKFLAAEAESLKDFDEFVENDEASAGDYFGHAEDCFQAGAKYGRADLASTLLKLAQKLSKEP